MANAIISSLCSGEVLLRSTSLAIVTREFVIVKGPNENSHTIIGLSRLTGLKRITTTYPALLVISAGMCVIGAAAFCSKQGAGAGAPALLLSAVFATGYYLSRRAAVAFIVGAGTTETAPGSPGEVAALIKAVYAAQDRLLATE